MAQQQIRTTELDSKALLSLLSNQNAGGARGSECGASLGADCSLGANCATGADCGSLGANCGQGASCWTRSEAMFEHLAGAD